jgi:hypothetical protein
VCRRFNKKLGKIDYIIIQSSLRAQERKRERKERKRDGDF